MLLGQVHVGSLLHDWSESSSSQRYTTACSAADNIKNSILQSMSQQLAYGGEQGVNEVKISFENHL